MTDAPGTGGRHLVQPRHLSELTLQRRSDQRGHHVGAGAGVQRGHLDGRVIHFRQGRHRQQPVGDEAGDQDGHHRQRGGHGPQDEQARRAHGGVRLSGGRGGAGGRARAQRLVGRLGYRVRSLGHVDLGPARRRSVPSVTTRSPGCRPSLTATMPLLTAPSLTCRTATVSSSWTRKTKAPAEPAAPPRWESRWRPARGHVQAGIDELVRKQRVVGIVEARLELERAGGDVDLVVQRFQLAGGDAAGIGPVIGLHGQRVAGRQLGPHFGQLGLGQREHHGDGLGLGDDHRPLVSELDTRLPLSTWRRPRRPLMGAVMRE